MATYFAIFERREDSRYHLADAIGSRVFRTLGGARRFAQAFLADTCIVGMTAEKIVIVNAQAIAKHAAKIDQNNRISLTEACPCPLPSSGRVVETCTYHGSL